MSVTTPDEIDPPHEKLPQEMDLARPVSRVFHLLDVVAASPRPLRFVELERLVSLPKATLHRMLRQLQSERMLQFDPESQRYSMGIRAIRFAHAAWESASLASVARPTLEALQASLGHTVHLACLDGGHVLYLVKQADRAMLGSFSRPGRVGPAYCTGVGKAMLAALAQEEQDAALRRQLLHRHTPNTITSIALLKRHLAEIRERGYSIDNEEHEIGVICVASSIVSAKGVLLGGVSVSTTTTSTPLDRLVAHSGDVIEAARAIARQADVQMLDLDAVSAKEKKREVK